VASDEKMKLENTISHFKTNNETSIWIKKMVRQEMESLQSNPRRLLRCALASISQSETNHPGKLMALYYNNPSTLSVERIMSISQTEQYPGQYRFDGDNLEKLLLDEAEQVLTRIIESLANKCLNEITNDTPRLQVPNMLPGPPVNEDRSTAINVFTNDVESPSQQLLPPNTLPSQSLNKGHNTNPKASIDGISISEMYNNWLNEYVKSLG
jgi:hypothetical protein